MPRVSTRSETNSYNQIIRIVVLSALGLAVFSTLTKQRSDIDIGFHYLDDAADNKDPGRKSFTELLIKSGSDKYAKHHYEKYYSRWLAPYRNKKGLKFMEIGANEGHSLNLWTDYFDRDPEIIVGVSYGTQTGLVPPGKFTTESGKYTVIKGDQSSPQTLKQLSRMGPWDVIIDDGSHVPEHMVISLFALWRTVKKGGMYIIEDLETNYWKTGTKLYDYPINGAGFQSDGKHSAVYKLKELIDVLARNQLGIPTSKISVMPDDESICSIEWGMNIVALRKCSVEEEKTLPINDYENQHSAEDLEEWRANVLRTNPR